MMPSLQPSAQLSMSRKRRRSAVAKGVGGKCAVAGATHKVLLPAALVSSGFVVLLSISKWFQLVLSAHLGVDRELLVVGGGGGRRLAHGEGEGENSSVEHAGMWLGLTLAAMLTKLTASTDDVVWLLPFLSGDRWRCNLVFYIFCMQLVVAISWAFSAGGEALLGLFVPENEAWPLERILELASAVLLTLYTVKLFHEWWGELGSDDEEEGAGGEDAPEPQQEEGPVEVVPAPVAVAPPAGASADGQSTATVFASGRRIVNLDEDGAAPDKDGSTNSPEVEAVVVGAGQQEEPPFQGHAVVAEGARQSGSLNDATSCERLSSAKRKADKYSLSRLFTISMFGSLDDFAVFVSLILSGVLTAAHLAMGVLLGSIIVVIVCTGAGMFSCVVRVVERIPLWCIIGAFAAWTYISALALD